MQHGGGLPVGQHEAGDVIHPVTVGLQADMPHAGTAHGCRHPLPLGGGRPVDHLAGADIRGVDETREIGLGVTDQQLADIGKLHLARVHDLDAQDLIAHGEPSQRALPAGRSLGVELLVTGIEEIGDHDPHAAAALGADQCLDTDDPSPPSADLRLEMQFELATWVDLFAAVGEVRVFAVELRAAEPRATLAAVRGLPGVLAAHLYGDIVRVLFDADDVAAVEAALAALSADTPPAGFEEISL